MEQHAAKQQQKPARVRGQSRIAMLNIRKHYFIFWDSEPIIGMWRRSEGRQKVSSEMEKVLPRTDERNQLTGFFDWLSDAFERASVRDHDRYVAGATNTREASQRLHEIEQGVPSFHA